MWGTYIVTSLGMASSLLRDTVQLRAWLSEHSLHLQVPAWRASSWHLGLQYHSARPELSSACSPCPSSARCVRLCCASGANCSLRWCAQVRLRPKKLLECAVLGQFVLKQVIQVCLLACTAAMSKQGSELESGTQEAHLQAAGWGKTAVAGVQVSAITAAAYGRPLSTLAQTDRDQLQIGHIAHLGGALAGVLLVALLSRLPSPS